MIQHHPIGLTLPFICSEPFDDTMQFAKVLNAQLTKDNGPDTNHLPMVAAWDLAYHRGVDYVLVYSPRVLGRVLTMQNADNSEDLHWAMTVLLEHWNTQFQRQQATTELMPCEHFVSYWTEACSEMSLNAQDLYQDWLAQRVKSTLLQNLPSSPLPSPTRKL